MDSSGSEQGPVARFIKDWDFLDWLSDSAPWCLLVQQNLPRNWTSEEGHVCHTLEWCKERCDVRNQVDRHCEHICVW